MRKALSVLTGTAFLAATFFNVVMHGFDPATTCSLISGAGFFIGTFWDL